MKCGSVYIYDVILCPAHPLVGRGVGLSILSIQEQQVNVLGTTEAIKSISLNFGLGINFLTSVSEMRNRIPCFKKLVSALKH